MAANELRKKLTVDIGVAADEASINALAAKLSKRFKDIEDNSKITINTENVKGLERLLSIFQKLDSELTDVKKSGRDVKAVLESAFGNALSKDVNTAIRDFSELGEQTANFVNRINDIGKNINAKGALSEISSLAGDLNKAFESVGLGQAINLEDWKFKNPQERLDDLLNATLKFTSAWSEGLLQMGHTTSGIASSMKEVASGTENVAKNVDNIGKSNGVKQLNEELDAAKKRLDKFSEAYKNFTTFEGMDAMLTGVEDSELEGHLTKVKQEYEEALKGYAQYTRGVKEGTATAEQGRKALERLAVAANEVLKINNSRAYNKVNNKQLKQWYQASGDGDKKQWAAVERAIKKGGLGVQEALTNDVIRLQQQVEVDVQPKVDGDTKGKVKKAVDNAVPDKVEADVQVDVGGTTDTDKLEKATQKLEEFKKLCEDIRSSWIRDDMSNIDLGINTEKLENAKNELEELGKQGLITAEQLNEVSKAYNWAQSDLQNIKSSNSARGYDLSGSGDGYYYESGSGSYEDYYDEYRDEKDRADELAGDLAVERQKNADLGKQLNEALEAAGKKGSGTGDGPGFDDNAPWARETTLQTTNKALDNINEGIGKLIQEEKQDDPKKKVEEEKDKVEDKNALEMQKKMKHLEGMNKVLQDEISALKSKMKDDEPNKKVDVDGEDGEGQLVKTLSSINETLGTLNATLKMSDDPENKKSITIDGMESITGDINSILGVLKGDDGNESKLNATLGSIDGALNTLNATLKTPDEQKAAKPIVVEGLSDISSNVGSILGVIKGDEESSLSKQATQALMEAAKAMNKLVSDDDNKNALKNAKDSKKKDSGQKRHDDAFDDDKTAEKEAVKLVNDFVKSGTKIFTTLQKDGTVAFNTMKEVGNVITKMSGIVTKKGIDDESLRIKTHVSGDAQAELARQHNQIAFGGIDANDSQLQKYNAEYAKLLQMANAYADQQDALSDEQVANWNNQIKLVKDLGNALMNVMKKQGLFDVDLVKENSTKQLDAFVEKMQKAGLYSKDMQNAVAALRTDISNIGDADGLERFTKNFDMLKVDYEIAIEKQKEYNAILKQFKEATKIRFQMIGMDQASAEFADLKQQHDALMKDINKRSQKLGKGQFDTRSGMAEITAGALKENVHAQSVSLDKFVEHAKKAGMYTEELENKVGQLKAQLMKVQGVAQFESWVSDFDKIQREYDESIAAQKEYNQILDDFRKAEKIRFQMIGLDETTAEFMKLKMAYDELMTGVNAKSKAFKNSNFDLNEGKATVTKDVFKSSRDQQTDVLDKFVINAKNAGIYTDALESKVNELKIRLFSLDDSSGLASWVSDFNKLQSECDQTVAATAAAQKELNELIKIRQKIGSKEAQLRSNTLTGDAKAGIQADLDRLYAEDDIKTRNLGSYSKSVLDAIGVTERLDASVREVEQAIANADARSKTAFSGFANKFDDISRGYQKLNDNIKGFNFDTDQADDLQKYQEAYKKLIDLKQKFEAKGKADLTDADKSAWKSAVDDLNKYEKKIKDVVKASEKLRSSAAKADDIKIIDKSVINDLDRLENEMTEFARSMNLGELSDISFDRELKELTATAKDSSGAIRQVKVALDSVNPAFVRSATVAKQTESSWGKFMSSIKNKSREMAAYFMTFGSFYDIINVVRNGVISVKEIDDALVELRKVTDETEASYNRFLQTMSQTGSKIGATVKDLTTSAADWARLGWSMEDAGKLAENTAVLMNVSEFTDVNEATDTLVSTMQAFGYKSAEDSMKVIDLWNEVGKLIAEAA